MGTTAPGALPYPEPTDPVAAGAQNIRALAEAVNPKIVHRFASVAARDAAYPAATAGAGAMCVTTDTGTTWTVIGNAWVALVAKPQLSAYAKNYFATPFNVDTLLGGTAGYVSNAAVVNNQTPGTVVFAVGAASLKSTGPNCAGNVYTSYIPPSGGGPIVFGSPGTVYLPGIFNQVTVCPLGAMVMTEVGAYQFVLRGQSSTGATFVVANTGSISLVTFGSGLGS